MDISKDLETLSAKAQDEAEHLLEAAQDFVRKVREYLDKWTQQK